VGMLSARLKGSRAGVLGVDILYSNVWLHRMQHASSGIARSEIKRKQTSVPSFHSPLEVGLLNPTSGSEGAVSSTAGQGRARPLNDIYSILG